MIIVNGAESEGRDNILSFHQDRNKKKAFQKKKKIGDNYFLFNYLVSEMETKLLALSET